MLLLLSLIQLTIAADTIPFRYGWRFHYGPGPDDAPGPGNCEYEKQVGLSTCTDLEHNPNRFTPDDCRIGCCYEPTCMVWQQNGRACYWGNASSVCSGKNGSSATNAGGMRTSFQPLKYDYKYAAKDFDDSDWPQIDVPFDSVLNGTFTDSTDTHHGYLPRNVSWFRKKFVLPQDGGVYMLEFEGTFHYTEVYINGNHVMDHSIGYTPYSIRLDNISGLTSESVISLRTDASYGSGHWYEGGGIRWDVNLVRYNSTHIARHGAFVVPQVDGATPSKGIACSAEMVTEDGAMQAMAVSATFTLWSESMTKVGSCTTKTVMTDATGTPVIGTCSLMPEGPLDLWSVKSPTLYTIKVQLMSENKDVLDTRTWLTGFRSAHFSATDGLNMNGESVNFRGFSHHDSFGGTGTAMPPRVDLFRAQAGRMLGSNVWRMSHNPYHPPLYAILDAIGTTVWDENRDLGPWYIRGMKDMVKRDRNHPSILLWSFCNEFECGQNSNYTGLAMRAAALSEDTSRPLTSNINGAIIPGVDVQGFSHKNNQSIISFHEAHPSYPTVLSECCSCTSHRLPVSDRSPTSTCIREQNSPGLLPFDSGSLGVWTLFDYFGESHTWPNYACAFGQFDIAGSPKPHAYWYVVNWNQLRPENDAGRPSVPRQEVARLLDLANQLPSSKGGFSISGIATTPRSELLVNGKSVGVQVPSRLGDAISWDVNVSSIAWANNNQQCSFPINVSVVQCKGLLKVDHINSAKECEQAACASTSSNVWQYSEDSSHGGCWVGNVEISGCAVNPNSGLKWVGGGRVISPYNFGIHNITLHGLDDNNNVVAKDMMRTSKTLQGSMLKGSIDIPSVSSGTGSKLVLDGTDTGMVRVTLTDSDGILVDLDDEAVNVTFKVVSGPGQLLGVVSGDPASHDYQRGTTVRSFAGTAKALIQVNVDCTSEGRDVAMKVDLDSKRTTIVPSTSSCDEYTKDPIVVEASSGSMSVRMMIDVSSNPDKDSWLAVARSTAKNLTSYSYITDFRG